MRFGIATINAGITSDAKWGSSKKGKTQSTADLLTRGWSEMNEDFIIDAVFSQEVGGMLEGGHAALSEKLQSAASAFAWQRSGSFLCGIRSTHGLQFTSTSRVSVTGNTKIARRYVQKVDLKDQNQCLVASFVNLHALQGGRGRTTTAAETVLHLETAKANLSPAPVQVILGDINKT